MRTIYLFISLFLELMIGCKQQEPALEGFEVKGEVDGLGNSELLMIKFVNGGIELDTLTSQNDAFTYTGEVNEPYLVQLMVKQGDTNTIKLTEFMLENSRISVSGNAVAYDSVRVSGSESDRVLKAYFKEDDALMEQWNGLKLEYDQAVQAGDTTARKKLARQLNKILQEDRVGLLKEYVYEHSNTTVGALLPAFCTIEDVLTPEDYNELYEVLSDSIKVTDYGKNLKELAQVEADPVPGE